MSRRTAYRGLRFPEMSRLDNNVAFKQLNSLAGIARRGRNDPP